MSSVILDSGALIAVDRGNHDAVALIANRVARGYDLHTSAMVLAEVWRDPRGRQAQLSRLLRAVTVHPVTERAGRAAGILVGRAGTDDPVDAVVVLLAEDGDQIFTSDPRDLRALILGAGLRVQVVTW